jgi:hypothetical protein
MLQESLSTWQIVLILVLVVIVVAVTVGAIVFFNLYKRSRGYARKMVIRRLSQKDTRRYSHFDTVLKEFVIGDVEDWLRKHGFTQIKFVPRLRKNESRLKIFCRYHNLALTIVFDETGFEYRVHVSGYATKRHADGGARQDYRNDFQCEKMIGELAGMLEKDDRLKKNQGLHR